MCSYGLYWADEAARRRERIDRVIGSTGVGVGNGSGLETHRVAFFVGLVTVSHPRHFKPFTTPFA
jgi:hypothetical protein